MSRKQNSIIDNLLRRNERPAMKVRQSSITSLMMLGVLSSTLIYTCIFCMLAYTQIDNTLDVLRNQLLSEQAYNIAATLETGDGKAGKGQRPAQASFGNAGPLYQYVVRNSTTGDVLFHSPDAYTAGFPASFPENGGSRYFSFTVPQHPRYLGASIRYSANDGKDYIIQIAQSEASIQAFSDILSKTFLQRISLFGIPFLFLLMLIIALTIRLIMSPIAKALNQAQEISFAKPDIRLNDSIFPQEIQPLARAVNDALDRLEKGITTQRDFIANAAHELRTPLSILRTHVDLLQDKDTAAKMRADVDTMARLVSQLLDTARLESPERLDMHEIDLAAVVKTVSQAVWPLMVKDERLFDVRGIDEPSIVIGNFDLVCRALRNLLENALHHTPRGTPISVTLTGRSIMVHDKGRGIPDDYREKIFEKFGRKDMQQSGGAGLGLFIVKKTMQLHGGRVEVANAPGSGCVFTLIFPDTKT